MNKKQLLPFVLLLLLLLPACSQAVTPDPNAPKPSKPGGTGDALSLQGDSENGKLIFADKCSECHGEEGKGGILNEGSTDGYIPALNPVDPALANQDSKVFTANLDVFIEHGSTPAGDSPTRIMMPFGDSNLLKPQEIADVIAYIVSLNPQE